MTGLLHSLPYLLLAILAVTLIDSVGAIASRKWSFNYGYLTPVPLGVYMLLGYWIGSVAGVNMVILGSLVVGFYDATVGWGLAKICKANMMIPEDLERGMTMNHVLLVMMLLSPTFSYIGYLFQ